MFHNAKQSLPIHYILNAIGHPQLQPTPICTDNSTSAGYVNNNMQMKRSKTWDMHLHWLCDKEKHKQFKVFWDKGINQGADYFTKHHPIIHHRHIRLSKKYIRDFHGELRSHLKSNMSNVSQVTVRVC